MQRPSTLKRRRALLEEATAIIEAEYPGPIDVDDLALRVATSRRQLQRVFSEMTGRPIRTHIAEVRMRNAGELLDGRPDLTAREIAFMVGHRQPAQFSKAFRRVMGYSPTQWRARRNGHGAGHP